MANEVQIGENSVEISRIFPHPREVVFDAWTDPAQLAAWWGCRQTNRVTATSEPHEGGAVRYVMHMDHGDVVCEGRYEAYDRPSRLVTRCTMGAGTDFEFESTTTVEFHDEAGGTRVRLTQVGLPPMPEACHIVQGGLGDSLDKLTKMLSA